MAMAMTGRRCPAILNETDIWFLAQVKTKTATMPRHVNVS
jgi:hypothetical protein